MLLVDQQFRIADDVDEKDMRDLKLHFLFNLGRHRAKLRQNKAIDNSTSRRPSKAKRGFAKLELEAQNLLDSDSDL